MAVVLGMRSTDADHEPPLVTSGRWPLVLATALLLALPARASSPVLEVDGMTFVASKQDRNELVLKAVHARFDTEGEIAYLDEVHAVVESGQDSTSFEMRCDKGQLHLSTNDFEAEGNVRGRTQGGREFSAPWVKYDHEQGLLFTDAPVLITEDAITYEGGGFRYYVQDQRFRLMGGARVVQQP